MDPKGSSKKGSPPQQNGFLGSILVCRRVTSHSFQESFFPANNISGQPTGVCTWQRLTRITNQPRELSPYCDTHTPHLTLHLVGCCWTSGTRVFWSNPKGDHRETERQIHFVSSSREKSPIFKTQNFSYLKNTCCCLQACCFEGKARERTAILGSRSLYARRELQAAAFGLLAAAQEDARRTSELLPREAARALFWLKCDRNQVAPVRLLGLGKPKGNPKPFLSRCSVRCDINWLIPGMSSAQKTHWPFKQTVLPYCLGAKIGAAAVSFGFPFKTVQMAHLVNTRGSIIACTIIL